MTGELRPGGEFTIHFDDDDVPRCRIVTCEAPRLLVWEWPQGDVRSLVTVEVRGDGEGAWLALRHERLRPAQVAGYAAGWDTYVRRLDADLGGRAIPDWAETWAALNELYSCVR